jgi:hypothetical protein
MNYEKAPAVFTGKDLNYLCDMFKWHYGAYKKTATREDNVKDEEIEEMMDRAADTYFRHMETILEILKGGSNE